ncbi:sigma factor [Fulvivirgaceae bacterium BMA12]|uniref:Sigma factor n=1 Tax=Agaribacillus aureus TaxID=3051825 RepID=A0ABT8LIJ4_9BACT|nr:sigma factor [Fulvivirgaceae bacterium BMA12]
MGNYEDTLLQEIIRGDRVAFNELVRRHHDALHHFAVLHVKYEEVAQDIVQAVFNRIWRFRESIDPGVSSRDYVSGLIAEVIYNYLSNVGGERRTRAELWHQAKKAVEQGHELKVNGRTHRKRYRHIAWFLLQILLIYQFTVP